MTDLITNLRSLSRYEHADLSLGDEAADEIERLRAVLEWRSFSDPPTSACNILLWYGNLVFLNRDGSAANEAMSEGRDCRLDLGYYDPNCLEAPWRHLLTGHDLFESPHDDEKPTLYAVIARPKQEALL